MKIVTRPPLESYLNWVPDTMPPSTRRLADLTSPAPSENTPPKDVSRKLPRRLRPRRRRGKQPAFLANQNSASRVADPATPLGPSANENSARAGSSSATRPRSTANGNSPFPGPQPRTSRSPKSASVKHPRTFQRSQHPQHPRSAANESRERRFCLDHPEIRGYINWPSTASGRILKPTVIETPSPDLASPHLLSSNPPTNPSLDRPLGLYF